MPGVIDFERENDRRIGIDWPLPIPEDGGMSDRDRGLPSLPADFGGLTA